MKKNFLVKVIQSIIIVLTLFFNNVPFPKKLSDDIVNKSVDTIIDSDIKSDTHEIVPVNYISILKPKKVFKISEKVSRIKYKKNKINKITPIKNIFKINNFYNNLLYDKKGSIKIREPTII